MAQCGIPWGSRHDAGGVKAATGPWGDTQVTSKGCLHLLASKCDIV